jgi:hypothetical protein
MFAIAPTHKVPPAIVSSPYRNRSNERLIPMLHTIAVVFIILWLPGLVGLYTMGVWLIHIPLVVALIMILVNFIPGRCSL